MLCDKCKKNVATFHRSVNINGKGFETHLCSKCAAGLEGDPFVTALSDMFDDNMYWDEDEREFVSVFDNPMLNSIEPKQMPDKPKDYKLDQDVLDTSSKLEALQNQIKLAVENENYEEAAKLKKEIEKLKQQNN